MLYPSLWDYRTAVKTTIRFSTYQLVHEVELVLPVGYEIPSLKPAIDILQKTSKLEECLVHLEHLDEQRQDALMDLDINTCHAKD